MCLDVRAEDMLPVPALLPFRRHNSRCYVTQDPNEHECHAHTCIQRGSWNLNSTLSSSPLGKPLRAAVRLTAWAPRMPTRCIACVASARRQVPCACAGCPQQQQRLTFLRLCRMPAAPVRRAYHSSRGRASTSPALNPVSPSVSSAARQSRSARAASRSVHRPSLVTAAWPPSVSASRHAYVGEGKGEGERRGKKGQGAGKGRGGRGQAKVCA